MGETLRSVAEDWWYAGLRAWIRLISVVVFRVRTFGRENLPQSGAAILLANHQSHLDPPLIGMNANRRLSYLARQSLMKFAPLRWLFLSLGAIPIDREGSGLSGLKATLKQLKRDQIVLMFPEGTRTPDGRVRRMKPGFCSVARRSKVPLLPAAIVGAYVAWPKQRWFPWPSPIVVTFGPPISPEEVAKLDDAELVAEVERRIRALHEEGVEQLKNTFGAPAFASIGRRSTLPQSQESAARAKHRPRPMPLVASEAE